MARSWTASRVKTSLCSLEQLGREPEIHDVIKTEALKRDKNQEKRIRDVTKRWKAGLRFIWK